MDSFEWNKIFMGLGFSALAVLGINELTKAVYHVETPAESGYVVAGVEDVGGGGGAGASGPAALPDFGTVLASADIAAGEKQAAKCAACHTWSKGGANGIGPNLYGIIGAKHAHLSDYSYSKAMQDKAGETWDYVALYQFLDAPARTIKGTKMAFAGLKKSDDRINLLAYMRTWADAPYPLPAAAPADGAAEAPADGAAPAPEGAPAEEAAPAPTPETTPEATPEATPAAEEPAPAEATPTPAEEPAAEPQAEPEATPEAEPEAAPAEEAAPEATPEPTPGE